MSAFFRSCGFWESSSESESMLWSTCLRLLAVVVILGSAVFAMTGLLELRELKISLLRNLFLTGVLSGVLSLTSVEDMIVVVGLT